jgi:hypothetical protein
MQIEKVNARERFAELILNLIKIDISRKRGPNKEHPVLVIHELAVLRHV